MFRSRILCKMKRDRTSTPESARTDCKGRISRDHSDNSDDDRPLPLNRSKRVVENKAGNEDSDDDAPLPINPKHLKRCSNAQHVECVEPLTSKTTAAGTGEVQVPESIVNLCCRVPVTSATVAGSWYATASTRKIQHACCTAGFAGRAAAAASTRQGLRPASTQNVKGARKSGS